MPSTIEYIPELGVVQSTHVGRVTADEFKEATIKAIALAKEHNTSLFLIDDSKWKGGASVLGLYELPALHTELDADRASKGALILPPLDTAAAEDARFYENVCLNSGWQVKVFSERQDAIDWLTKEESSNNPDARDGS